jgi:hypothetical protein
VREQVEKATVFRALNLRKNHANGSDPACR